MFGGTLLNLATTEPRGSVLSVRMTGTNKADKPEEAFLATEFCSGLSLYPPETIDGGDLLQE